MRGLRREIVTKKPDDSAKNRLSCSYERFLAQKNDFSRCPNVKHFRLIPTLRYGVFRRKCDCGNGLGTTPLFGRGKLTAICPCGIELGTNIGQTKLLAFPIVGGPSAGKTAFLMATIYTLVNKIAPQYGWQLKYPYDKDRETADNAKYLVENGIPPLKTTLAQILPTAFNLEIDDGSRIPKRLYYYDPAGEAFRKSDELSSHGYYGYMNGIIFLIDPFSIPAVVKHYGEKIAASSSIMQICNDTPEKCSDSLLLSLERDHNRKENDRTPCAIVITKADAFDLDRVVGEQRIADYMKQYPNAPYLESMNILCRYFLYDQCKLTNFISNIESRFKMVRYFSVSSMGHMPVGGKPYAPTRLAYPIQWLLEESSPEIFNK